ncbi:hypothetical protein AMJ86_05180, partial [bacterium SM23_57]
MSDLLQYRFLNASSSGDHGCPVLVGCPYDGTSSFRPGARFGPSAIRQASVGLETYSPDLDMDLEDGSFEDIGDLELPMGDCQKALEIIARQVRSILDRGKLPFCLGGEHTISIPAITEIQKRHSSLKVVQLDAHLDLRQEYLEEEICHATVMRRIGDMVGMQNILQLGVRSGTREEWQLARDHKTIKDSSEDILQWVGDSPGYLTVDLDVFDPGVMGGIGTPEPGGWMYGDFLKVIMKLQSFEWVGVDVVELSPHYDPSGASAIL